MLVKPAANAISDSGSVVVSVFVNPLQFGAGEDLDRYPRDLDADLAICEREGVALVFAPGEAVLFDDQRLLHGRTAFVPGPRCLWKCSVSRTTA